MLRSREDTVQLLIGKLSHFQKIIGLEYWFRADLTFTLQVLMGVLGFHIMDTMSNFLYLADIIGTSDISILSRCYGKWGEGENGGYGGHLTTWGGIYSAAALI